MCVRLRYLLRYDASSLSILLSVSGIQVSFSLMPLICAV